MSLSFVHTARRYYRLNVLVRSSAWFSERLSGRSVYIEKMLKLDHLEEVKVVTRYPSVAILGSLCPIHDYKQG